MGEIIQFIALPFEHVSGGIVAGEQVKCGSAASAIERAQGFWKLFGHAGAVAFVRTGYPATSTTVLRKFGMVPDDLSTL
jgi:hypothetical protein